MTNDVLPHGIEVTALAVSLRYIYTNLKALVEPPTCCSEPGDSVRVINIDAPLEEHNEDLPSANLLCEELTSSFKSGSPEGLRLGRRLVAFMLRRKLVVLEVEDGRGVGEVGHEGRLMTFSTCWGDDSGQAVEMERLLEPDTFRLSLARAPAS